MRVAQVFQSYSNMGEYQGEIFNHGGILEKRAEHQGLHNYSQLQLQQGWILGLHKDEVLEKKCWRRHRNIWRCIVNATGDLPMASIPRISSGGLQNATKRKVEFQIPVDSLDGFHKSPRGKGWQGSLILNRNWLNTVYQIGRLGRLVCIHSTL